MHYNIIPIKNIIGCTLKVYCTVYNSIYTCRGFSKTVNYFKYKTISV